MPKGSPALEGVLKGVTNLAADSPQRNVDVNGPIRLLSSTHEDACWHGEMIRIRMDEIPIRASLRGDVDLFDLEDDEGVGEETGFMYVPRTKTLVLQRNRLSVSASAWATYFKVQAKLDDFIVLLPIIEPGTMARLNEIQEIRQIDIRFAGIRNPDELKKKSVGVEKMMELLDTFDAPSARLYLSMGHDKRGGLNRKVAKTALLKLLGAARADGGNVIAKLEISGRTADEELQVVDLLRDRMIERDELDLDVNRRWPYSRRKKSLYDAWKRRETQLLAQFAAGD